MTIEDKRDILVDNYLRYAEAAKRMQAIDNRVITGICEWEPLRLHVTSQLLRELVGDNDLTEKKRQDGCTEVGFTYRGIYFFALEGCYGTS